MTLNYSYQSELEALIIDTLLPAYIKSEKAKGNKDPLRDINKKLIDQIKQAKKLPALLRPYENLTCATPTKQV